MFKDKWHGSHLDDAPSGGLHYRTLTPPPQCYQTGQRRVKGGNLTLRLTTESVRCTSRSGSNWRLQNKMAALRSVMFCSILYNDRRHETYLSIIRTWQMDLWQSLCETVDCYYYKLYLKCFYISYLSLNIRLLPFWPWPGEIKGCVVCKEPCEDSEEPRLKQPQPICQLRVGGQQLVSKTRSSKKICRRGVNTSPWHIITHCPIQSLQTCGTFLVNNFKCLFHCLFWNKVLFSQDQVWNVFI